MFVLGLTGGIGTGKSETARILRELGAAVIDADHVGHEAYRPHSEIWQEVVKTFGSGVLQADREIDRKALGLIVFADPQARAQLNAIMHPRMAKIIQERIRQLDEEGAEVVVVEAALLFEADWAYLVDEVWVTSAPDEEAIRRISQRSSLSEEEVRGRMSSQMPTREKLNRADVVVKNAGGLEELNAHVHCLWNSRVKGRIGQL